MNVAHFSFARGQPAQQRFNFSMLAGVCGEYLYEPAIIRQLFQPDMSRFESVAGQRPDFWFDSL